jgi:hypothetical protein
MSRPAVRILLGVLLVVILLLAASGALVWWKISHLKEQMVKNLGAAIGADVQISSIQLDPWKGEFRAVGISLVNQRPSAPWDKGDISQATVHFHLSDLFSPKLPVTVEVSSWNLTLHGSPVVAPTGTPSSSQAMEDTSSASSAPGWIQVTALSAQEGTVEVDFAQDKKMMARGVAFESSDNGGGVWNTQLRAVSITAGTLQAGPSSVLIRGETGKVAFSELRMQCDQGGITGDGELTLDGNHDAKIDLKAADVPVTMLVALKWQLKLSGLASGSLIYQGNDQGGDAKGNLAVTHGKFNVLPWLGKVTTLVGLEDISGVELDKATSDFEWKNGTFHLTNIDIRKNDVTRIAGSVDVDALGQIDGHIKLGFPSTVTSKWPQMQNQVFPVQLEDYNWADVHLTGTPDNLQEDLTSRLFAAGVGQGSDMINQATQKASDLLNSFLGK